MTCCGVFGQAFASPLVSIRGGNDAQRFLNWKNCKHLETKMGDGPQGLFFYPACMKGYVVERVDGSNLGKLFRGKHVKCSEYDEITSVVKPQLVEREQLELLNMSQEEIRKILGDRIIV